MSRLDSPCLWREKRCKALIFAPDLTRTMLMDTYEETPTPKIQSSLHQISKALPHLAANVSNIVNSPLAAFAETNYSASTAQQVAEVSSALSNVSLMIQDIESISQELDRLKKDLKAAATNQSRLVSAVLRVPIEILANIFVLSLLQRHHIHAFYPILRVEALPSAALNVAQVCRKWRHIALNTPHLWNIIKVTPGGHTPILSSLISLPKDLLGRSASLPVVVELRIGGALIEEDEDFNRLPGNPEYDGVQCVDVETAKYVDCGPIFQWLSQFRCITHLTFKQVLFADISPNSTASLDHLTHLHLHLRQKLDATMFIKSRTWQNMKSLTMMVWNDLDDEILQSIFLHAPDLEELFVLAQACTLSEHQRSISSPKLRLFSLTTYVDSFSEESTPSIVSILTFPALSDLVLPTPEDGDINQVRRFLARSQCRLNSLTFTNMSGRDDVGGLIRQEAAKVQQEFPIRAIEFADGLHKTRLYCETRDRWYSYDI
ncbi:hypothetical protein CONPUDRAFT_163605 [Coniophora puteana RWD-64-598 SS2]|uniref:F-box domain-containing protein n=1 Tax=Coniophora puteana (strain RWD-64-598) TaxID=741705 RepID=A0A5M3MZC8_CONPW|nr:uncharacterized protein CONPUDRAFT_163605 [Coniophora puteana RWD-64-598 SS2]EIW84502.1 hypothetical protein CONPUDRAFT_163605 [Coniophora puteana RWD-64-598 SS2]